MFPHSIPSRCPVPQRCIALEAVLLKNSTSMLYWSANLTPGVGTHLSKHWLNTGAYAKSRGWVIFHETRVSKVRTPRRSRMNSRKDEAILLDSRWGLQTLTYQKWGCKLFAVYTRNKQVTCPNKLTIECSFLFQTAMSVPSPKMDLETFMYQDNATRLLHSTTKSCFEHLGALLNIDRACRSIIR